MNFSLINSVSAQDSSGQVPAARPAGPNGLASFLPFLMIFVIFYFLLIRPQKKKLEEEQSMISALKKGDEIYTKTGLIGTIVGMTDKVITLEVADGVKLKVLRSTIGGTTQKLFEQKGNETAVPQLEKAEKKKS